MSNPLNESASLHHRSLGEKLLRVASSVGRLETSEFASFLEMFLSHDSPPSIRFCESSPFLWPSFLDLSQPLSDSTRSLLRFCISPAVLSIGFSKKGKQANPSFELYHPAVFARQFGFGQAVSKLILTERLRIRDRIKSRRGIESDSRRHAEREHWLGCCPREVCAVCRTS